MLGHRRGLEKYWKKCTSFATYFMMWALDAAVLSLHETISAPCAGIWLACLMRLTCCSKLQFLLTKFFFGLVGCVMKERIITSCLDILKTTKLFHGHFDCTAKWLERGGVQLGAGIRSLVSIRGDCILPEEVALCSHTCECAVVGVSSLCLLKCPSSLGTLDAGFRSGCGGCALSLRTAPAACCVLGGCAVEVSSKMLVGRPWATGSSFSYKFRSHSGSTIISRTWRGRATGWYVVALPQHTAPMSLDFIFLQRCDPALSQRTVRWYESTNTDSRSLVAPDLF
jgi:hypothetical protein